ncbi:MAG: dTMP kinase [Balneolales bacterium]
MLITFEGIDGSGKSTQIERLRDKLIREKLNVSVFREPGGTNLSEKIRELLLDQDNEIDPITEALLFSSARSQLISEVVKPKLEKDEIIILDRFYDSTIAYQGYGRKSMPVSELHELNKIASHGLVPDITFYLKIDLDQSEKRRTHFIKDRMEQSGIEFYQRVIRGFDELANQVSRFRTIDASASIEEIENEVWDHIGPMIKS